ncbi:hypothetical protein [Photobacterium sp. TY1-4]|uniref:hypothetical protein n=1 Tax=Photobacterium sp. TY1-4 TaxID=2899122 RepID=UPI0021BEED1A|nr:hypothetical protein [Photobacterium sp. TY1-4]UXI02761.1 hypothetical protein NH461_08375 [Photobacterium sp. TY1-4]
MIDLSARYLFKEFYRSQRVCRNESSDTYVAYTSITRLISCAYAYQHEYDTLRKLFDASKASNLVALNKRKSEIPQSPKLQAALAKYRKGAAC